jgi:2-pyrone-4,6-dicarboxylate lactonase
MTKPTTNDFTKTAGWMQWYTGPAKPKFKWPAGAVVNPMRLYWPEEN